MADVPKKMSIFARKMQAQKEETLSTKSETLDTGQPSTERMPGQIFGEKSYVLSGSDAQDIHLDNVNKLKDMTPEEIERERQRLLTALDPDLICFVKSLRRKEVEMKTDNSENSTTDNEKMDESDTVEVPADLLNKYPHMDVVEIDKLKWTGELPSIAEIPTVPYSARFNFDGDLLPYVDKGEGVLQGLHNHGEEQERPGYTLQELMQLSRSSVLQQRIIALNTLAKIMANASKYDACFEEPLLPSLLEGNMYLILRFSLDDTTQPVVMASAVALCNLIVNHTDEVCLDILMGTPFGLQQPSMGVQLDMKKEEVNELKDVELLKLDVIQGTFRTNLLERIKYILKRLPAEPVEAKHMIKILIRIARHSFHTANAVLTCPELLETVRQLLDKRNDGSFYPEALKLFRILSSRSITLASEIIDNYAILDPIFRFISGERAQGHPEAMQLSLESFYTWQTFLNYKLATSSVESFCPVLTKLLMAHLEYTTMESAQSDLEHGTALVSTLTAVAKVDPASIMYAVPFMTQAAAKWLRLYGDYIEPSFSASKLVGSVVLFFASLSEDLVDRHEFDALIAKLLNKPSFVHSVQRLRKFSWLISGEIKSSPENLPCLGSVPPNVHKENTFSFVYCLATYLLFSGNPTLINKFIKNNEILNYVDDVLNGENIVRRSGHWYARQELHLLVLLVHLYTKSDISENQRIFHRLASILLTSVQRGDKHLIPDIVSRTIFNPKFFSYDLENMAMDFEALKMDDRVVAVDKFNILRQAMNDLQKIENCYTKELGLVGLNPPWPPVTLTGTLNATESALPTDWVFLPLLRLYEREGEDKDSIEVVVRCLQWFILMEQCCPEAASLVSLTAKYCRLCCVFLTGNSLFMDVNPLLELSLSYINAKESELNFNETISGLNSFYDFYRQLLEQYTGVSYCNPTFGQYILVPLAQRHDPKYKKIIWSELAACLRYLSTPISAVDMNLYLRETESDENILMTYLRSLGTGMIRPNWCPVLYEVAVHHVTSYIKENENKLSKMLFDLIQKMGNKCIFMAVTAHEWDPLTLWKLYHEATVTPQPPSSASYWATYPHAYPTPDPDLLAALMPVKPMPHLSEYPTSWILPKRNWWTGEYDRGKFKDFLLAEHKSLSDEEENLSGA